MATTAQRRTPETLTAADRALQLGIPTSPPMTNTTKPSTRNEKYEQQALKALQGGLPTLGRNAGNSNPNPTVTALTVDPKADGQDSVMLLSINDIEFFEGNPRKTKNASYKDIKASIKKDGITNMLTVTRPPEASKYHPYGGGNTRLAIAKELFAEGDMRFAQLYVKGKEWTDVTNVLIAHISENTNREDMTFWDSANAVETLRKQLEEKQNKKFTTNELSQELKHSGINFGLRMIQHFAFAIEHLIPIGKWLTSTPIRNTIQPGLIPIFKLGQIFDELQPFKSELNTILNQYADDLEALEAFNAESDPADQKPVELNADALVADAHALAARLIGEPVEKLAVMLSALEANSRLKGEDLRAIQMPRKAVLVAAKRLTSSPAGHSQAAPGAAGLQSGTPAPTTSPQGQQVPLAGMLAAVGTPASGAHLANPADQALRQRVTIEPHPELPADVPPDSPVAPVISLIVEINDLVGLNDAILISTALPFGYWVDIPTVSFTDCPEGENAVQRKVRLLRPAIWKLLASLSGQTDPAWFPAVDKEHSTWLQALAKGGEDFAEAYATKLGGMTDSFNSPQVELVELARLFSNPDAAFLVIKLLRVMEQIRLDHPERFIPPNKTSL